MVGWLCRPLHHHWKVARLYPQHTSGAHGWRVGLTTLLPSLSRLSRQNVGLFFFFFFIYLVCGAIGTAATPGLLCQPRVIVKMIVEKQMECR
jgi:hypothetical protein